MIAVVIPCYNEFNRFPKKEFIDYVLNENSSIDVHYFLVNDGSNDNTIELLNQIKDELSIANVTVINFLKNRGKAETIRHAFIEIKALNKYTWFGYLDADFATHPRELYKMYQMLAAQEKFKMAIGARWLRLGAKIVRNPYRHYFGRIFATIASIMLQLKVYDTQCGAKVLHADFITTICNEEFESKWIFDVEIFARLINKYGIEDIENRIIEIPLDSWQEIGESKIQIKDLLVLPFELLKIKKRYKL